MIEKRKRERVAYSPEFSFCIEGETEIRGRLTDLSMGGAQIIVPSSSGLNAHQTGTFTMYLSFGEESLEVCTEATVMRVQADPESDARDIVGVAFSKLSSDSSIEIYRCTRYAALKS